MSKKEEQQMTDAMINKELFDYLVAEYNHPFSGWNFSYLDGRREVIRSGKQPWNYTDTVLTAMQQVQSMLDMGTGGGERLAQLATIHPLPAQTFATEGYPPNVVVARQRLAPLGVTVREVNDDNHLPFADNQFDLIINRHAIFPTRYYDVGAIAYYLKAISWEVPDFSVEKYFDKLVEIHHLIQKDGFVDVLFHQFFIVARKM